MLLTKYHQTRFCSRCALRPNASFGCRVKWFQRHSVGSVSCSIRSLHTKPTLFSLRSGISSRLADRWGVGGHARRRRVNSCAEFSGTSIPCHTGAQRRRQKRLFRRGHQPTTVHRRCAPSAAREHIWTGPRFFYVYDTAEINTKTLSKGFKIVSYLRIFGHVLRISFRVRPPKIERWLR